MTIGTGAIGQRAIAANGGRIADGQVGFTGTAILAAAGERAPRYQAAFVGTAQLAGRGALQRASGTTMAGAGALAGRPGRLRRSGVALPGQATFTVAARRVRIGRAALAGSSTFYARPVRAYLGTATFAGSASLAVDPAFRLYAATDEFITHPEDIPASQPFLGTLQKAIRLDRSILNGGRIGQVTAGWGDLELINAEGDYDDIIDRYAVDGRRVVVKVGVAGGPYDAYQILFDGTAADMQVEESILRIKVRDNAYRLEVPAQGRLYAGTGGLEGGDDLKGKRLPLLLGERANLSPVPVIPNLLVYQITSGPMQAVTAVYDRAVALAFARDYPTAAALLAAGTGAAGSGADIEAGRYATCLAAGLLRLGGSPIGAVTCDARGDRTGGAYVDTTAGIVRRLVALATDIRDPDGLVAATFAAVQAAQPAVVGYWLDGSGDASVADVVADLMNGVGGWAGMRRNGRLEIGVFTAPSGQPTARYDRVDIVDIARERLPEGLSPPPWRFRVAWGRNDTVQSDILDANSPGGSAGVTPARVAFLREARRLATSNDLTGRRLRADHPLAQDPAPVEAFFRDEAAAKAEADRLLALFGPTASLYRIRLKVRPFSHEIGETVHVTFPRWDLRQGRLLRIVALTDDTDSDDVEMIGFG